MFRTPILAGMAALLLGGTAFAQSANSGAAGSQPRNLSDSARSAPDYDDADDAAPPAATRDDANRDYRAPDARADDRRAAADDQRSRDIFCRRDAAARTGYVTPHEAARDEQTRGTIGGTLGGAALGAIIGGAAGNAGTGAAIGAGAGLLAGTAVGSSNAREAAADVREAYGRAYWDCMREAGSVPAGAYDEAYDDVPPPPPAYAYGPPPPPPVYYRPYGYYPYYPYYYGPTYYGPSVGLSFGFGGGRHWGGHGWHGRHR
jgi:hypothetical protein